MTTPVILVAKYTPNLERMEPRNAGVIIWSPSRVSALFLGETSDGKFSRPNMVPKDEWHAYREWLTYWRIMLNKESVKNNVGKPILRSSPDFVEILKAKSKSSFALIDAGFMMNHVETTDIPEVAQECFEYLVTDTSTSHIAEHKKALRGAIHDVLQIAGVRERDDFRRRVPVPCRINNVKKDLVFDYAVGNDKLPFAVFQGVSLPDDRSVIYAATMFSRLQHTKRLRSVERCAFILGKPETDISDESHANLQILKFSADVIDVSDPEIAARRVKKKVA